MDKATQKSIEWQKANHPMAIGGDAFADMIDSFNVNPAFVAGYKEAEQDLALTWEDVAILITIYEQGVDNGDYRRYNDAEWMKEYSQDILRRFNEIRKK